MHLIAFYQAYAFRKEPKLQLVGTLEFLFQAGFQIIATEVEEHGYFIHAQRGSELLFKLKGPIEIDPSYIPLQLRIRVGSDQLVNLFFGFKCAFDGHMGSMERICHIYFSDLMKLYRSECLRKQI